MPLLIPLTALFYPINGTTMDFLLFCTMSAVKSSYYGGEHTFLLIWSPNQLHVRDAATRERCSSTSDPAELRVPWTGSISPEIPDQHGLCQCLFLGRSLNSLTFLLNNPTLLANPKHLLPFSVTPDTSPAISQFLSNHSKNLYKYCGATV